MSIAKKFEVIADAVYEKGMRDKESEFWDFVQNYGNRPYYDYGFKGWGSEYIRPKYKVVPTQSSVSNVFNGCKNLKKIEKEYFDFSQVPEPTYEGIGNYYTFMGCTNLVEVEDVGFRPEYYSNTFRGCESLTTIEKLRFSENTKLIKDVFASCPSLTNIEIEGVIPIDINFSSCPLLSDASLENIAQHLKDFLPEWKEGDGNKAIITLHATVKERIKNTEIGNLIKSKKWGIA